MVSNLRTNDAVSTDSVFAVSEYFDVVGLMAKTVEDVATLLECTLDDIPRSKLPADGYKSVLVT
jgi:Asp-tRNA(Asn)/Glu-tRNA(Gln) amidotransferase A subunit family amidase